jgi:hypothetical protein
MSTTKSTIASHKRPESSQPSPAVDARTELAEVMKKLQAIETELAVLLRRSLCDTLHASGDVAGDIDTVVRQLLGNAFGATREVSQSLLQAGQRTADAGRTTARNAVATVQDFGWMAREAAGQVMRGAAEGLAEIRAARTPGH